MCGVSYLLDQPVVRGVPAELHVRSVAPGLQPGLGHLQRSLLVSQTFPQSLDVFLLVVDLLHRLGEVRLELVVSVCCLLDSLLEVDVCVVPVTPHLVGAGRHQVVHLSHQSLRG